MNRRGITTIELLLCFIIVMIITVSMFATVSAYNEKRILEGYKEQITNYKNTLTKEIQDDIIKVGVSSVTYERTVTNSEHKGALPKVMAVYTVNMDLRDGSKRQLVIEQSLTKSMYHPAGYEGAVNIDDYFMIKYGEPTSLIEYKLPDLGSYKSEETGKKALDFSINNVLINIYDEKVLSIYIGFYHPEFGTRYCIDITALIDFSFTGAEFINQQKVQFFILWNLEGGSYVNGVTPNPRGYDQTTLPLGPLSPPSKDNYTFLGWTGSCGTTPLPEYTIPRGTTGILSFTANYRKNRLVFRYKLGDGEEIRRNTTGTNGDQYVWTKGTDGYVYRSINNGATGLYSHYIEFDATSLDLCNYDNDKFIYISRPGYTAVSGAQWKCLSGCSTANLTFNQNPFTVNPATVCDYKDGDCKIDIGVNWKTTTYNIKYNLDGGVANNPTTYNIGTETFDLNNPTKTGYTFTGWTGTDVPNLSTKVTIPKGSINDREFTAHYSINSYTVSYNNNGGSGTMDSHSCTYNTDCALSTNTFTAPTGKKFGGWYNAATGGTFLGTSTKLTSDIVAYARWVNTETTFTAGRSTSFTAPVKGTYQLEVWGAQGGTGCQNGTCGHAGGRGGYSKGNISLNAGDVVYVVVGKQGTSGTNSSCNGAAGGYNGGGSSGKDSNCDSGTLDSAGGGGGATHIGKDNALLKNTTKDRVYIVAGGGGGGAFLGAGGSGGGSSGTRYNNNCGIPGDQTGTGLTFGQGGNGVDCTGPVGGAGGGLYGGKYTTACDCPGTGGSGYIGGVLSGTGSTVAGNRSGDGAAKITFLNP